MNNIITARPNSREASFEKRWNAESYHLNSSVQLEASQELLSKISFQGNESILDVGCGDGKITAMLSSYIPQGQATGIDSSPEMVLFANKNFKDSGHKNFKFKLLDATKIRFDKEFDMVFSCFALHWITNFNLFMEKVRKALKNNGKVAFTIPLGISSPLEQATKELMESSTWAKFFTDYVDLWNNLNSSQYKKLILDSGFKVNYCEVISNKKIFDSRSSFESYVIQWYPHISYVDTNLKKAFFSDLIDKYLEIEPSCIGKTVNFEFPRIDIIAQIT